MLLSGIPSLCEFKVTQDFADEPSSGRGILTPCFFAKFSSVVGSVKTFIAQGSNSLKIKAGDTWVSGFIAMLEFQFKHNLQKVDVQSSRTLGGFCPFTPYVDAFVKSLQGRGQEVWVHCAEVSHEMPAGWVDPSLFDVFNSDDDYSEPMVSEDGDSNSAESVESDEADEADSIFSSDTSSSG
ncbi:hypothetical protein C8R44DRAFT_736632 [Mycena epipterygia]|nr:hypothetical protein C8R44DRAFT_736632 [Mycena epipterygia]